MILYNSIGEVKDDYSASYLTCPAILRYHVRGTTEYVYFPAWFDKRKGIVISADNQEVDYKYWTVAETDGSEEGYLIYDKFCKEKL